MFGRRGEGDGGLADVDVELLPPDSPFSRGAGTGWEMSPSATGSTGEITDARSPRWTRLGGGVAALVVVAVVAVSAVSSGDDHGARDAPTTTAAADTKADATTSAPSTTSPRLTVSTETGTTATTPLPADQLGFVLDDVPYGLTNSRAHSWDFGDFDWPASDVQLWTTPAATRTSGSWLLLEVVRQAGFVGGTHWKGHRTALGAGIGVVATSADGVMAVSFQLGGKAVAPSSNAAISVSTAVAVLTSFGIGEAELIAVAASVTVDAADVASIGDVPAGMGNRMHSRAFPPSVFTGAVDYLAQTHISTVYDDGDQGWLSIGIGDAPVDFPTLLPYLMVDARQQRIGNWDLWIGTQPVGDWPVDSTSITEAVFTDRDGRWVTVSTTLDPVQLGAAMTSLRRASPSEWQRLLEDTKEADQSAATDSEPTPPIQLPSSEVVAEDTSLGQGSWSVQVATDNGGSLSIRTGDTEAQLPIPNTPTIVPVVGTDRTIVVAIGADPNAIGTLTVLIDGQVVQQATGGGYLDGQVAAAVVVFDQPGPYTVELRDTAGNLVATTTQ